MNQVTLFIYATSVVDQVALITVLASIGFGVFAIVLMCLEECGPKAAKKYMIASAACAVIFALIPTKQTMYLMAGSQVSETILTSEKGQDVLSEVEGISMDTLKLIRKHIDSELDAQEGTDHEGE